MSKKEKRNRYLRSQICETARLATESLKISYHEGNTG